jgi:hypothetical protein
MERRYLSWPWITMIFFFYKGMYGAMENSILGLPCIANPVGPVVVDARLVSVVSLPGILVIPVEGTD